MRLQQWIEDARAAHPSISLSTEIFIVAIAERLQTATNIEALVEQINRLQASDLFLALACARSDAPALDRFELLFGAELLGHARRFANDRFSSEDLLQTLREKVLVKMNADRPPKISTYSGQGPLRSWLTVTALRTFLDCSRSNIQQKREMVLDGAAIEALIAPGDDLEIVFLKEKYRADFRAAFSTALLSLESGERNLLRYHWVSGLSIDQIGIIYHIHRATAARRIIRVRDALMNATRNELAHRIKIGTDELDSVMALIHSRLEASVFRLLGESSTLPLASTKNA